MAQHLQEGLQRRHGTAPFAAAAQDLAFPLRAGQEFIQQSGLAHAGIADDLHDARMARARVLHMLAQVLQFRPAAAERGQAPPPAGLVAIAHFRPTQNLVGGDALALAFQLQRFQLGGDEERRDAAQCGRAGDNLVFPGRAAEARGGVNGISDKFERAVEEIALTDQDQSGIDAGVQLQREVIGQVIAQLEFCRCPVQVQRGFRGALDIVLPRFGIAEQGQDAIAVELRNQPVRPGDNPGRHGFDRPDHMRQMLRIHRLAQPGGAADVGVQDRYIAPLIPVLTFVTDLAAAH